MEENDQDFLQYPLAYKVERRSRGYVRCLSTVVAVVFMAGAFLGYFTEKVTPSILWMSSSPKYTDSNSSSRSTRNISMSSVLDSKAEIRHVAFLKVHKTGSSTVQNIFLRFGETRALTFILGTMQNNECGGWPNCISFNNTLNDNNIVSAPGDKQFDILCCHVIYNRHQFAKYLPQDTRYIGLVREPALRLESAINFFNQPKGVSLSEYAKNPLEYDFYMLNNRMAFEFGFKKEWLPTKAHPTLLESERSEISKYIDQLFTDFDLILVNERLDESLVLMKRMLNWRTEDILYTAKLAKKHANFDKNDETNIKSYLSLDYMLYERAVNKLEEHITKTGHDFVDEVSSYKRTRINVEAFCAKSDASSTLTIKATRWNPSFLVDNVLCGTIREGEISYTWRLRVKQYGGTTLSELEDSNGPSAGWKKLMVGILSKTKFDLSSLQQTPAKLTDVKKKGT